MLVSNSMSARIIDSLIDNLLNDDYSKEISMNDNIEYYSDRIIELTSQRADLIKCLSKVDKHSQKKILLQISDLETRIKEYVDLKNALLQQPRKRFDSELIFQFDD
jgi:hypothetical protein